MTKREEEQASQIMTLMATLSTTNTEIARLRELITQHYRDNEGHNHCFRNNFRLWEGIGLLPKQLKLPPLEEFKLGCRTFQEQLYSEPDRYPDFYSDPMDSR